MEYKNLECKNCGATMGFDVKSVSMKCSFCGSEHLIEFEESDEKKELLKLAEIILFQTDREKAQQLFTNWLKKGLFKPKDLLNAFRNKEFDGIYIPFYKIKADAESSWHGRDRVDSEAEDYGANVGGYIKNELKSELKEQHVRYEKRSGKHNKSYKDYVAATKGLPQFEVDMILPFDDNNTKSYDNQLLMGYKFEKPAINVENALEMGKERIKRFERNECSKKVDDLQDINTTIGGIKNNLIMLPLWIIVYSYKNTPYRVMINGQTGKIYGKKPVSKIKVLFALIMLSLLIAAGFFIYNYLK